METVNLGVSEKKKLNVDVFCEEALQKLYALLNDFSDEIPAEIIHSYDINNRFKIRSGWFQIISLKIGILYKRGLLPVNIVNECDTCIQNYHTRHNENGGLTTREDIDAMNRILRKTIEHLSTHKI